MTYDYFCENCEKKFEVEQSIKERPLCNCPKCGTEGSLKRLISGGSGFVLKGSGWAADNYSSKKD